MPKIDARPKVTPECAAATLPQLINFYGQEAKVRLEWIVREPPPATVVSQFNNAAKIADFWRGHVTKASWYDPDKEAVVVLCLNRKNALKAWNLVSLGSITASLCSPDCVFRPAIVAAAAAIALIHNHPSGDPAPSQQDFSVTRQVRSGARVLDMKFLDHVIVGTPEADPLGRGYYSFREAGLL